MYCSLFPNSVPWGVGSSLAIEVSTRSIRTWISLLLSWLMERELKSICTSPFQAASCSSGWAWTLSSRRSRRTFSPSWKNSFPACLPEMTLSACCRRPSSVLRVSGCPSSHGFQEGWLAPGVLPGGQSEHACTSLPLSLCLWRGCWVCDVGLGMGILCWNPLPRFLPGCLANPRANAYSVCTCWINSIW